MAVKDAKKILLELVSKKFPSASEMPDFFELTPDDLGWDSIDEATLALELSESMGLDMVPDGIEGISFEELARAFQSAAR